MIKSSCSLAIGLVLLSAPVSAQWTLTWGNGDDPACYDGGQGVMCLSAQMVYEASGATSFSIWNRSSATGNTLGAIDAFAFMGLAAPAGNPPAFTVTDPSGAVVGSGVFAFGEPPLGNLDDWGWGYSGAGKIAEVGHSGGSPPNTYFTDWNGFGGGGAVVFSFMLAAGLDIPEGGVMLNAHVRDGVFVNGKWTSDRYGCLDNRFDMCGDEDDPGGPQETIPEPATMTLLATGLAGLAASRRRKK